MISLASVLIALIVSLSAGSATQQPHSGHGIVLPTDTILPHP